MRCRGCAADVADGWLYCIRCGARVDAVPAGVGPDGADAHAGVAPGSASRDVVAAGAVNVQTPPGPRIRPRLVACPRCGASNAGSRERCGRCRTDLRADGAGAPAAAATTASAASTAEAERDVPVTLVVFTTVAVLAVAGVVLTILTARGLGPFGAGVGAVELPGRPAPVPVVEVRASSVLSPSGDVAYDPSNLLDDDPATAWMEGVAGDGVDEWVELRLERPVAVSRLLVWNGYQRDDERHAEHNRVARMHIGLGERLFTADLVDVRGPQAIDLPEAVVGDVVRLTILDVHAGSRYEDTALSAVQVFAATP